MTDMAEEIKKTDKNRTKKRESTHQLNTNDNPTSTADSLDNKKSTEIMPDTKLLSAEAVSGNIKINETKHSQVVKKRSYIPALVIVILIVFLIVASISQRVFDFFKNKDNVKAEEQIENIVASENSVVETPIDGEVMGSESANPTVTEEVKFKSPPPEIAAKAFGIVDLVNNKDVYSKNPGLSLPPASVTKIMTAIVALESYQLDKEVLIPEECTLLNASKAGFRAYDVITLQDALYGLLVQSGADAACAIANIDGNETEFIEKMNRKANEMGLENTSFQNEIGLDAENSQYSSVNDIILMSEYALKYDTFRKIVGTKEVTINSLNNPQTVYKLKNTNDLLFNIPGTVGIKTGVTPDAGECLSYLYENPSLNEKILIVILGSSDRFGDTKVLLDWAKEQLAPPTTDSNTD